MIEAPTCYTVETVLGCNLKCPGCACGTGRISRRHQHMSLEAYQKIAEKIRPWAKMVLLHNWGEPMLNAGIYDMIELTQEFATPNIHTNGCCEIDVKRLAASRADIVVSIDAVTQPVYEKYRVGGSVEQAWRTFEELANLREQHPTGGTLHPQVLLFEHNQHELNPFLALVAKLGLQTRVKMPHFAFSTSLKPYPGTEFNPRRPGSAATMRVCKNIDHDTVVLVDGTVVPCCYDYDGEVGLGNLLGPATMPALWSSPGYVSFRESVRTGPPLFCTTHCAAPPDGVYACYVVKLKEEEAGS